MTLDDLFKQNTNPLGQGGAPSYDLNSPLGQALFGMTLNAGGAGQVGHGVQAFLGNRYQPTYAKTSLSAMNGGNDATNTGQNYNSLFNLGSQLGYGGNLEDMYKVYQNNQYDPMSGGAPKLDPNTGQIIGNPGRDAQNANESFDKYYSGLQDYLKDYYSIQGLSSGWDGSSNNARSASNTLYRDDGNRVLNPVSAPQGYTAREKGNWFQENPEFMSIVSTMLPAVGGWAGLANLAGAGVSGASAAGVNAAGGALMGAATGGTNGAITGLAGSLGGYAGGQAAGALGGSSWTGVGQQLGSTLGKGLAQANLPQQQGINPGTGYNTQAYLQGQPTRAENEALAWNNRF